MADLTPELDAAISTLDAELDAADDFDLEAALGELDELTATYRNLLNAGVR